MTAVLLTVAVLLPATSAAAAKPDRMYPAAQGYASGEIRPMVSVELEIEPVEVLTDGIFQSTGGIAWWLIAALCISGLSILCAAALMIHRRKLESTTARPAD